MIYNNKIGIAIAGIGFGEKVHLPALTNNKFLEPIALWHPNKDKANDASKRNRIRAFNNWNELLKEQAIKGIIIATPPSPRFELARSALQAGKHLLLEKPVALNNSQINQLQRLSLTNKLSVAVDFEYRAVPLFMQAKRILTEEKIGKIWFIKLDWIMSSRADTSREWNWYSNKEEGGGVIGALGTHAFDILHWLFGPSRTVSAQLSTSIKERFLSNPNEKIIKEVTSEDICLAQIEIDNPDSHTKIPTQVSLSSVSLNGRGCWLEVYGSKGTLILGSDNQKDYVHGFGLWLSQKNGPLKSISADSDLQFSKTWKDGRIAPVARIQNWWSESIRLGSPIIPGLLEGAQSQKVCEKIKISAESGLKVSLDETL